MTQTRKYKHDSLIAWSGGVESTALVVWALEQGYNPLCYNVLSYWDPRTITQIQSTTAMSKKLGVECLTMENVVYGDLQPNELAGGTPHTYDFDFWMYWGLKIWTINWGIDALWYGNNTGRDVDGDGKGDKTSDCFLKCKEGTKLMASGLRPDRPFDIVAPYERPKMTLWESIPDNIKPHVYSSDRHVDMRREPLYNRQYR